MASKFQNHLKNHDINYIPMEFDGKKIIFMKQGRSAGTAVWKHTLRPYVYSRNGWSGGQGCTNDDDISKNWLNNVTDDEIKNEYFIFTFTRNPFSRVVSCWGEGNRHSRGMKCSPDFDFFVKNELKTDRDTDGGFHNSHYTPSSVHSEYDDGELFIDWHGKVENIQKDWKILCDKISIPYSEFPHIKSGHTVKHHYKHYYTEELVEIVAHYYKRDLELFNYEF